MEKEGSKGLSRRAFLQGALGVLAAAALPDWFSDKTLVAEVERIAAVPQYQGLLCHAVRVGTLVSEDTHIGNMGNMVLPRMISEHEQLIVQPARAFQIHYDYALFVRDLKANTLTPLDRLARLYNRSFEPLSQKNGISVSPDGRYLLWPTDAGVHLVSRDGLVHHHWPGVRGSNWMGDSRHWCSLEVNHEDVRNTYVQAVNIYGVDGAVESERRMIAPDSSLRLFYGEFGSNYVITQTQVLATNWKSARWTKHPGDIYILHLGFERGTSPLCPVALPEGRTVVAMEFSPPGNAIAWVLGQRDTEAARTQDGPPKNRECDYTLAISDADGSAMREIGSIRSWLYPTDRMDLDFVIKMYTDYWSVATWQPGHLYWLPDNRRVCFYYDKALWFVATEALDLE